MWQAYMSDPTSSYFCMFDGIFLCCGWYQTFVIRFVCLASEPLLCSGNLHVYEPGRGTKTTTYSSCNCRHWLSQSSLQPGPGTWPRDAPWFRFKNLGALFHVVAVVTAPTKTISAVEVSTMQTLANGTQWQQRQQQFLYQISAAMSLLLGSLELCPLAFQWFWQLLILSKPSSLA